MFWYDYSTIHPREGGKLTINNDFFAGNFIVPVSSKSTLHFLHNCPRTKYKLWASKVNIDMQLAQFFESMSYQFVVHMYSSCQYMDIDNSSRNYSMDEQSLDGIFSQENNTDDSYLSSSSFSFSDSDDSERNDELRMSRGIFTNETAPEVKLVTILNLITEKLQCFLGSGLIARDSMFYSLLDNSENYVYWLNERKRKITHYSSNGIVKSFSLLRHLSIIEEGEL